MNLIKRAKPNINQPSELGESGLLNEGVLMLVFESINWDPHVLSLTACVSRKLRAIAKRVLWRELCISRAPNMVAALANGAPSGRVGGGWHALGKLLFFCCGCVPSQHFRVERSLPGHFMKKSRFSKTSGQSFLMKRCYGDVLYISDQCEHVAEGNEDDIGIYRGVFRGFMRSKTRAILIRRQVELEERVRCPYCGARVWSMTAARLVPRSASRRLGSHQGNVEYFVCINGHLHGSCWLVPLSSDEDDGFDEDEDDDHESHRAGSSSGEVVDDVPTVSFINGC